jgi:hypothetical protein
VKFDPGPIPAFTDTAIHYAAGAYLLRDVVKVKGIALIQKDELPKGMRKHAHVHGYLYGLLKQLKGEGILP